MTNPIAQELREWAMSRHMHTVNLSMDAWCATIRYRVNAQDEGLVKLQRDDRRTFALLVAEALESEE